MRWRIPEVVNLARVFPKIEQLAVIAVVIDSQFIPFVNVGFDMNRRRLVVVLYDNVFPNTRLCARPGWHLVFACHRAWNVNPSGTEERRCQINQALQRIRLHACRHNPRIPHDERHPNHIFVVERAFCDEPVLPVKMPMVGRENDEGVLRKPQRV